MRIVLAPDSFKGGLSAGQVCEAAESGIKEKIKRFHPDIIFTAEGEINAQTARGKVPCGVGRIGRELGIPVITLAGALGTGYEKAYSCGITAMFSITDRPMSIETSTGHGNLSAGPPPA